MRAERNQEMAKNRASSRSKINNKILQNIKHLQVPHELVQPADSLERHCKKNRIVYPSQNNLNELQRQ